jgi:hypothetical protein
MKTPLMNNSAAQRPQKIELDDYRWLVSSAAERWLASLADEQRPSAATVAALRRELSAARTHLVLEQIELRRRAKQKFSAADRMYFTGRALEQATDEVTAAYKGLRFARAEQAIDLCCGLGGDLLAMAEQCPVIGVDRDEAMVVLAEANARVALAEVASHVAFQTRNVDEVDVRQYAAWHIDPDRRSTGRRTTRVELYEPSVEIIDRLLVQNPNAAIKLAPASEVPETWQRAGELEWISRHRECRQQVAWFGNLAGRPGQRRATVLGNAPTPLRTLVAVPLETEPPASNRAGRFVMEPDAAVLAAGLAPNLAAEHGLARITAGIGYWTGDALPTDAALSCFEVEEVLPLDVKRLRALLRERNVGRLEIKKRGVEVSPERLRQELQLAGDEARTLIVMRLDRRVTAILAQRIDTDR